MRATRWLGVAALLAATACGPDEGPAPQGLPLDADRDGYPVEIDCDDQDPGVYLEHEGYVDADRDGAGAGPLVAYCAGYGDVPGYSGNDADCDDADANAYHLADVYPDADADSYGEGDPVRRCVGATIPAGYAAAGGDCAPGDGTRWREHPYAFRDADLDGVTRTEAGVVCAAAALPAGYAIQAFGDDCDDTDPAAWQVLSYGALDGDLDGVGVTFLGALCGGAALPSGYLALPGPDDCDDGDRSAWQMLDGYVDADLDGAGAGPFVLVCSGATLAAGYARLDGDCDDGNADAWRMLPGFADADRDGFGAGLELALCSGEALPAGNAATGSDCAPEDADAWRPWTYAYRDADGDRRTVVEVGTLCIGGAPPDGYLTIAAGSDCDDHDPRIFAAVTAYADEDLDAVGAGAALSFCTDGAIPAPYVATSTDCAPDDAAAWRLLAYAFMDSDGDGHTVPVTAGQACSGETLPDLYHAAATGNDCDDADASAYRAIVRYPDRDGDGVGATPRAIFCVAADEPAGHSSFGWDLDDADPAVDWDDDDEDLILLVLF